MDDSGEGAVDKSQNEADTVKTESQDVTSPSTGETDNSKTNEQIADHETVDPAVVEKLSLGVLEHFLPDLQKSKSNLDELKENQRILVETVQQENMKFNECVTLEEVTKVLEKAKQYHNKLVNIKKDMAALHEKSAKLKKRAVKIQQQKQKEALQREQQREKELEKERQLIAKPAKKT